MKLIGTNCLNQGSDAIPSQLKLGEKGGSVVTRDCGVGICLGRSARESVCDGLGAGDGNGGHEEHDEDEIAETAAVRRII